MFRIGQKVVLVEDGGFDLYPDERAPTRGEIVTIRHMEINEGRLGLALDEYRNPPHYPDYPFPECVFMAWRFRPVVDRKTETGMAVLREILDRESHQDRVPERVRE